MTIPRQRSPRLPDLKSPLFIVVVVVLLLLLVIALGLCEPRKERFGGLADLLAGLDVDVFLAGLGAPFGQNFFGEEIFVVEGDEDFGGLVEEIGIFLAAEPDEALDASKEGLLVLLRCTNLETC